MEATEYLTIPIFLRMQGKDMRSVMLDDLVKRLRALSKCEHDDLSIGDEAADCILEFESLVLATEKELREKASAALDSYFNNDKEGLLERMRKLDNVINT